MAVLAVVRPGSGAGEARAAFIRRAHHEEPARAPHARLAARLAETRGLLLYEEDLMAAIAALTGWPLEHADDMRAALAAATDDPAALATLQRSFTAAAHHAGVSPADAAAVWHDLTGFAAYSVNKGHAAGDARLAWQAAFLKTHHPREWACAVLNHYGGHYPLRTVAADGARHGVRFLPPHVNHSALAHTVEGDGVRIGLGIVKGLARRHAEALLAHRPFADVAQVLDRVPLPLRELEALVLCGALDGLDPLDPAGYPLAHEDLLERLRHAPGAGALLRFQPRRDEGGRWDLYRSLVRLRHETAYLSLHLTDHPMRLLRDEARRAGCVTTRELASRPGRSARVAGIVAARRRLASRGGRFMQLVTLEDEEGLIELVVLPGVSLALGDAVTDPGPFLAAGRVDVDHGDVTLHITEIRPFHERPAPYAARQAG
jgi:DNA polymerase III alpha subunit